jgi:hypothetical protein
VRDLIALAVMGARHAHQKLLPAGWHLRMMSAGAALNCCCVDKVDQHRPMTDEMQYVTYYNLVESIRFNAYLGNLQMQVLALP